MKKIAVIRCLRTSNTCSGSGCLKAFNYKTKAFAIHAEEELEMVAFLNCSGCGDVQMLNHADGIKKKLERLVKLEVDTVHLSDCTQKKDLQGEKHECLQITEMAEYLKAHNIVVIRGTHH